MNLLEIKNLRKTFDELEVIQDISLSVKEGEVLSIIGPSGSGKSTLLRCATMLERMDSGTMSYMGCLLYTSKVCPYLDVPMRPALQECVSKARNTGNVEEALRNLELQIEHPQFRNLIRNLEICSRHEANYAETVSYTHLYRKACG